MTSDRMRIGVVMAALLFSAACAGSADEATVADEAATDVAEAVGTMSVAMQADVNRAAEIANATLAAPTKTDSILAANGLTADALETMMYRIAADSAASAEYRRRTSGN